MRGEEIQKMQKLSFDDTQTQIQTQELVLLYITMPNCSVCEAVKPRVEQLFAKVALPMLSLDAYENPKVAGTYQVMTAPAILIFYKGKEVHRQARFVNFKQLEELVRNYLTMSEPENYTDVFK